MNIWRLYPFHPLTNQLRHQAWAKDCHELHIFRALEECFSRDWWKAKGSVLLAFYIHQHYIQWSHLMVTSSGIFARKLLGHGIAPYLSKHEARLKGILQRIFVEFRFVRESATLEG